MCVETFCAAACHPAATSGRAHGVTLVQAVRAQPHLEVAGERLTHIAQHDAKQKCEAVDLAFAHAVSGRVHAVQVRLRFGGLRPRAEEAQRALPAVGRLDLAHADQRLRQLRAGDLL